MASRFFSLLFFSSSSLLLLLLPFFVGWSEGVVNVHVVPHTHDDVGWLKTVDQYYLGSNNSIQHAGVQYVLDSIYLALLQNPDRKFHYVEMAFFERWWNEQSDVVKNNMKDFVSQKRMEFSNGGWCMHDEATTYYIDMIDQTTLGHSFLFNNFGLDAVPTVGWQIDPFGHSASQSSYMTYGFGFSGLVVGRIDYQDRAIRTPEIEMEIVWNSSKSFSSGVFTSCDLGGNYQPPAGLCFDQFCADQPVQNDPRLEDYNVDERVDTFVTAANNQAAVTKGDDIIFKMGSDFQYENANEWYKNLDKLIDAVNSDGRVKAFYSTPRIYIESKKSLVWETKSDDFFPYSDNQNSYWTGYFTSRPAFKGFVRFASSMLQSFKQLVFWTDMEADSLVSFEQAMGVSQHHDAVAGTEKQHVTYDYTYRISNGISQGFENGINGALQKLIGDNTISFSQCPLTNISVCPSSNNQIGFSFVVYNPLSRSRNATVKIPVPSGSYTVYDSSGKHYSSIALFPAGETNAFVNESLSQNLFVQLVVPPNGFTTYFCQRKASSPKKIETLKKFQESKNEFYHTLLNHKGEIEQIKDLKSGEVVNFDVELGYYLSYYADNDQNSGAYIFRPGNDSATPLNTTSPSTFYTSSIVNETQTKINDWIFLKTRFYANSHFIEFEFTVGPIPIDDNNGKEMIVRYSTDIESKDTFYSDSNGREMQQRILDYRPTWTWNSTQPTAGNYYPINGGSFIKDDQRQFNVIVDRSQGGASLNSGDLEFMLHRRILNDDGRGVGEPLNETESITSYPNPQRIGYGLNVTTTHRISFGSSNPSDSSNANEYFRDSLSESYHDLQMFFFPYPEEAIEHWTKEHTTSGTFIDPTYTLPPNIDLETLFFHPNQNGALLRLGHKYAVGESATYSVPTQVQVDRLFPNNQIQSLTKEGLSAVPMREVIDWLTDGPPSPSPSSKKDESTIVTLNPMEIGTWFVQFAN